MKNNLNTCTLFNIRTQRLVNKQEMRELTTITSFAGRITVFTFFRSRNARHFFVFVIFVFRFEKSFHFLKKRFTTRNVRAGGISIPRERRCVFTRVCGSVVCAIRIRDRVRRVHAGEV